MAFGVTHPGETRVTGSGLPALRAVPLKTLDLSETAISDDGLENLQYLKKLEWLNLHATGLTDSRLGHIKAPPSLRKLYFVEFQSMTAHTPEGDVVRHGRLTDSGIKALRKRMPECEIEP